MFSSQQSVQAAGRSPGEIYADDIRPEQQPTLRLYQLISMISSQ